MNTIFQDINPPPSRVPRILGYGLAIASLVWVLRDFHVVQTLHEFARVDYRWVVLGMAFDVLSYGVQGLRWKWLLTPFGRTHLTRTIRAVYAGLFANLVIPLRPGELLRSYLLADSEEISIGKVLGSVGVERLVDLVIAASGLAIVSLTVDLGRFRKLADTLGIATLALLAIIVLLILYLEIKLGGEVAPAEKPKHMPGKAMAALQGLHAMGTAPSFYTAVLTSILMPFCQVVGLWAMMRGYGLNLSFMAAVVVLLVINLGVSLPNAPANMGSYQFFCVVGLGVFSVGKSTAAGFSFFAWFALTFPIALLGFAALVRSGLSLRSMREKVSHLPAEVPR
ncbi:MAG TPA: lysylphosphatidylglycerol synthase transmembrane domain-containing protein [Candidatus Sulfotelmatobacter sp.]|nr:lysylphosphatidylglycerol synthase transmembrane domain-containing protein [Candidatus Sulfotelmatobacter sp.]